MATGTNQPPPPEQPPQGIEMPEPTYWPMMLAAGITLLGMGVVLNYLFFAVGAIVFIIALVNWIGHLGPGKGHRHEEFVAPERRPQPVRAHRGDVEHLLPGMAGHRLRFPEKIHPYSAGIKGGIVGAIAMPVPALVYGIISGKGIWYPINLLAGMVLDLGNNDPQRLQEFHAGWLLTGIVIHAVTSVCVGLIYGVLLPMLPGRALIWGGVVAPLLWTGGIYSFMGVLNPALRDGVDWPSFIAAQFVFGVVCAMVVERTEKVYAEPVGRRGPRGEAPPTMEMPGAQP
jgi:Na+-transporting methylmalonyl-CoA/oxaloacetate decarboxylase gamma subunit